MTGMEDKVVASWKAFFETARMKWEDPVVRAARMLRIKEEELSVVLAETGIRARWSKDRELEQLQECIDETNIILMRLLPLRDTLPNTKAVVPPWHVVSNEEKRAWGCRLLEECLRVRVSDIRYGYLDPNDEVQYRHIVFGDKL